MRPVASPKKDKAMGQEVRKQVVDVFTQKLQRNFRLYCQEQSLPSDLEQFMTYIIDHGIIDKHTIRHYAILEVFNELYPANEHKKTQTVEQLARRFNVSARSIWNVLQKRRL